MVDTGEFFEMMWPGIMHVVNQLTNGLNLENTTQLTVVQTDSIQ